MGVVAKRSSMTLFSDPASHDSHRVRIVLGEKGIAVDIEEVDPLAVSEELMQLNPYGTTPTLVDRELCIYDSKVIMEYLDERFPHPPLMPVYPVARALTRQYMQRIDKDWSEAVDLLLHKGETKGAETARRLLRDSLLGIAPIFADKPYFMSDEFTLADCYLAPLLWRLDLLGVKLAGVRQARPLVEYMQRIFLRPAFRRSLTEVEREMRS